MEITSQNSQHNDRKNQEVTPVRKEYRRPVLTRFGDVRDITLGLSGTKEDGTTFEP